MVCSNKNLHLGPPTFCVEGALFGRRSTSRRAFFIAPMLAMKPQAHKCLPGVWSTGHSRTLSFL